MVSDFDVVVVGAGQAGLGIGYHLQECGVEFVILERGEIAESWRSQRWDSFAANTPNWMNGLPGSPYDGTSPDGFYLRDELVASFERHAAAHDLPVRLGVNVESVAAAEDSHGFIVKAVERDGQTLSLHTSNVVVASGLMRAPKIPPIQGRFPDTVTQLHASDFRSADMLPDGAVVVIGSGQSGCQITEDLISAGRSVYLCTSKVARAPRRYRGRDLTEWMSDLGMFDHRIQDLEDPMMQFAAQPQVSGVGRLGRTVSLQDLQRRGAVLMGRLSSVVDGVLDTDEALANHIAFADEFSTEIKRIIDDYAAEHGLDIAPPEIDPIDIPAGPDVARAGLTTLDIDAADIRTVIWCTGFTANLEWLRVPVTDEAGHPLHVRGVSTVRGIYFLGFPWLHTRKSGLIFGIDEDARHIVETINSAMT
jgi:putative flavoprotein involved in K+ transport